MAATKRNSIEPLRDGRSFGEVTFNYTSHDGRFLIGVVPWLFETRWSQAGNGSAYIYNDPVGIRGVAIAEGVQTIAAVDSGVIARSDFTSRTRTLHVGQCGIIENQDGYFAVLQPLRVGYSTVPSENTMTMRYAIQTDGSASFASLADPFDSKQAAVDQLLRAADEARTALASVRGGETSPSIEVGIGHNHPPAEFALTEEERLAALDAVEAVRGEIVQSAPSLNRLASAARTIAASAKAVGLWMAAKTDLALDEFAKTIGKASAIAAAGGFTAWAALHGKLSILAQLLAAFHG